MLELPPLRRPSAPPQPPRRRAARPTHVADRARALRRRRDRRCCAPPSPLRCAAKRWPRCPWPGAECSRPPCGMGARVAARHLLLSRRGGPSPPCRRGKWRGHRSRRRPRSKSRTARGGRAIGYRWSQWRGEEARHSRRAPRVETSRYRTGSVARSLLTDYEFWPRTPSGSVRMVTRTSAFPGVGRVSGAFRMPP